MGSVVEKHRETKQIPKTEIGVNSRAWKGKGERNPKNTIK